ncbi:MAG: type III-B CRISPR module RAMP protein Cmr6 [Lentisphaerae bacterium]|nr:type III-B CRISPR module RAMP protein Cmr6 [Lentisphaerota bacterium]
MSSHAQAHTLDLLGGPTAPVCENRSLRFSRYTDPSVKGDARRAFLEVAVAQKLPEDLRRSRAAAYDSFLDTIPGVIRVYARNKARLLLNMSGGVLENAGCSLERLAGFPLIPGSAVKGLVRHAALDTLKSDVQDLKPEHLARIAIVFGWTSADWSAKSDFVWAAADAISSAQEIIRSRLGSLPNDFAGAVAFFGAIPYTPRQNDLEIDIATSHHMDYYSDESVPVALDNEAPNPIPFPAIAANHDFGFALAPHSSIPGIRTLMPDLLECARQWLILGLEIYGLGAKTAAGYGWFHVDKTEDIQRDKQKRKQREAFDVWRTQFNLENVPTDRIESAIREAEAQLKTFAPLVDQTITDAINRNKFRIPRKSMRDEIRDRWNASPNIKGIINGDIKPFERASDEKKTAIVTLLREPDGRGAEVWSLLKSGQKGEIAKAADAIRAYCKNTLNLGKMPS